MDPTVDWKRFEDIFKEALELAKAKNQDYGTRSLLDFGAKGCLIRIDDKVARLKTLVWPDAESMRAVKDETVKDTALDIINYTIYMLMLREGRLERKDQGRVVYLNKTQDPSGDGGQEG